MIFNTKKLCFVFISFAVILNFSCQERLEAVSDEVHFIVNDATITESDIGTNATTACDLLLQNCQSGKTCVPNSSGVPRCVQEGELIEGELCGASQTGCKTGLLCAQALEGRALKCLQICDRNADSSCENQEYLCHPITILQTNAGLCDDPIGAFSD